MPKPMTPAHKAAIVSAFFGLACIAQAVVIYRYETGADISWLAFFAIIGMALTGIAITLMLPVRLEPSDTVVFKDTTMAYTGWPYPPETYGSSPMPADRTELPLPQWPMHPVDAQQPDAPHIVSMCHMSTNGVLLLYSDGTLWIGALDYRAKNGRMAPYLKLEQLA